LGAKGTAIAGAVGATAADATVAGNQVDAQGADAAIGVVKETASGGIQGILKAGGDALSKTPGKIGKIAGAVNRALTGGSGGLAEGAANATLDGATDLATEVVVDASCGDGSQNQC